METPIQETKPPKEQRFKPITEDDDYPMPANLRFKQELEKRRQSDDHFD